MPNGWHPVPGLDVVLVHRTEERSPRFEWGAFERRAWAVAMQGPRGLTPQGALPEHDFIGSTRDSRSSASRPRTTPLHFEDLVAATGSLMEPSLFFASAFTVDFEERRGHACGSFVVYGFWPGRVECLHDHGLLARYEATHGPLSDAQRAAAREGRVPNPATSGITHEGLGLDPFGGETFDTEAERVEACAFSFFEPGDLVISSVPLHHDARWPPASISDVPALAQARSPREDVLLLLWRDERA